MAERVEDGAHVEEAHALRVHLLRQCGELKVGIARAVREIGGVAVLIVDILARNGDIAVMPAVGFDLLLQRGVVLRDELCLRADVVIAHGGIVKLRQQDIVRDDSLVDHGTAENVQITPCDGLERGSSPGGVVAEQGLEVVEDLTAEDRFRRDLGKGGEVAVFVVGVAVFRQQDGRSHQDEQHAGKEQGHRPFTDTFHAQTPPFSEAEIDKGIERARDEPAVGKREQCEGGELRPHDEDAAGELAVTLFKRRFEQVFDRQGSNAAEQQLRPEFKRVVHGAAVAEGGGAAEHRGHVAQRSADIVRAEEHPAQNDEQHGVDMLQKRRKARERLTPEKLFADEQHKEPQAPRDERPVGPVPEARERPDEKEVQNIARAGAAVAAEGNVDIVAEPRGERDVPAPPELGDAAGDIGIVEVFKKVEAEHPAKADGHVGIGGKVEINLKRVGDGAEPRKGHRGGDGGKGGVGDLRDSVGEQHFLGKAEEKAHRARGEFGNGLVPLVDLVCDRGVAHDGTGDELGEKRDIECELERVSLHGGVIAENVDHIAETLEGKK